MNMSFFVIAKLLDATCTLLCASYFILTFCLLYALIQVDLKLIEIIFIGLSLLLTLLHHYLSIRVKLDSELLLMLYQQLHTKDTDQDTLTQQLDTTLVHLGLMSKKKTNRTWDLRFKGCLKLLNIQIGVLILQMTSLFALLVV
ncbi:hypothetical protein AMD27_07355 [Acinetobacter sp. TGL-Y2]|uniref:hypothetical protein n=1 Tax=Acinetobacter sp. TGL-Y2 TaxID=1407071 RepID=UPI0007A644F6|nr:hypothetical protein [Acinetobacter sp. TGL-Y2]AMW78714.1 hypothetical protein AMD27_07355 [Acinetobacter sp. TGL-Y2]